MNNADDLSIVIVTYNSADHIEDLLASIPAALGRLRAKITVVDNGSTDRTLEILSRHEAVMTIPSTNAGYAAGINRGVVDGAPTPAVLILNPDLVLGEGAASAMLRVLQRHRVGVVAPKVLDAQGRLVHSLRRDPTLLRGLGLGRWSMPLFADRVNQEAMYEHEQQVEWALGAALLLDRECFDLLGGWDDSYFLYSEETDYCLRARDHGWKVVYTPDATVTHIEGGSGRSALTHTMQVLNKVRLFSRRNSFLKSLVYYLITVASQLSWVIRGRAQSRDALLALVYPPRRPEPLGLKSVLIPR